MIQPANRMNRLSSSVFAELAEKKRAKVQAGQDIIDLSIGSPDLPPPQSVRDILSKEVQHADQYGYALQETEDFQTAVADYYKQQFGVSINADEVLQLIGSQDGLSHLALAYLDPGDYVIAPDPGYPIYAACASLANANLYTIPLHEENQFMPDFHRIPVEVVKKAKMMILNYPGNPTAALANKAYFEKAVAFGLEHNILIVHDFAYAELVFSQDKPLSIFHIPDAKKIAIECNSLSKSFNVAGARIGYAIGYPSYLKPLRDLKTNIDYGVFLPIQKAAAYALTYERPFLDKQRAVFKKRRDVFIRSLHENGWNVRVPEGGMFVWAKVPASYSSLSFALKALEHGVVVTPGSAFGEGGEGYVRIALVQPESSLKVAAQRLIEAVE
ncbi:hypothetical protein SAMN05192534_105146 [Alteribacillus persepolensis]|uniref:Aminotransferase n=1 Tax=Alteribacillus persepolensis TaxID=568899 RepID=A0A1G8CET7_9BACI|nr:LL-diaminopimelate aminotransferase [Alteribacillus persepolensis]SDH43400.1 hypothetical protein SAMN05192534_105146 [Alteribacillus persepolensis]